jgi:stage V sporulation protein B
MIQKPGERNKAKSILGGITILGAAGIICKLIGMAFRVVISNQIGEEGIGLYQLVYPTYTLLLTLSSAGLPVAISRMVAEATTRGDEHEARRILRTAVAMLGGIGLVLTIVMMAGSGIIAGIVGAEGAKLGYLMIAPSILIVSVMSAYRGFMQGHGNMMPTGLSQLVEQLGKVALSLPLAWLGLKISITHAAAFALLGITLSEAAALIYMFVTVSKHNRTVGAEKQTNTAERGSPLWLGMLKIALPITLGAAIVPLVGMIDTVMIKNRLVTAGFSDVEAVKLYGLQSGAVLSLLNVPTALAIAVAMSMVPAISAARARKDEQAMREHTAMSIRLSVLIGLPCALGMSLLSHGIVDLLYPNYAAASVDIAGRLLSIGAFTIPLFILVQATSGTLQGLGAQVIPMITLLFGAVVKAALNFTLVGTPSINIYGSPVASLACYAISTGINLFFVFRKTKLKFDWGAMLIRPIVAAIVMSAAVLAAARFIGTDSGVKTLVCVFIGIVAFIIAAPLTGAVNKDDLAQFPSVGRLLGKFRKKEKTI